MVEPTDDTEECSTSIAGVASRRSSVGVLSRRMVFRSLGGASLATLVAQSSASSRPATSEFDFDGTYLNAAAVHPMLRRSLRAVNLVAEGHKLGFRPGQAIDHPRDRAKLKFSGLINADLSEVSFVSGTMAAENMLVGALGLGTDAGVVTDDLHFDGSLALYLSLNKAGMPLTIVPSENGRVEPEWLLRAAGPKTRLISVALVSNVNGYQHDLEAICTAAHRRGILVYADIIQAAGTMPFDVKQSGVDFCACSTYKWLMGGDFGLGFMYARKEAWERIRRPVVSWRQLSARRDLGDPFNPQIVRLADFDFASDVSGHFEVSLPSDMAATSVAESLTFIREVGVDKIAANRLPLLKELREELPRLGFEPLTPENSTSAIVAFGYRGIDSRIRRRLLSENIWIQLYPNRIRIAPSIYNNTQDAARLMKVLISELG